MDRFNFQSEYLRSFKFISRKPKLPVPSFFLPRKELVIFLAVVIPVLLLVSLLLIRAINYRPQVVRPESEDSTSSQQLKPPRATTSINREFIFPLKDAQGKELGSLKYVIQDAELRDEIIIQGKKAFLTEGRTFLILTLKLVNDLDKSLEINTRDYVRLSVNNNENEWLAPDVYNDPVVVQPISTKYTRLGFTINTTDRDLKIRVGEITGTKEMIPINFKL